jgi:hypothetical protein
MKPPVHSRKKIFFAWSIAFLTLINFVQFWRVSFWKSYELPQAIRLNRPGVDALPFKERIAKEQVIGYLNGRHRPDSPFAPDWVGFAHLRYQNALAPVFLDIAHPFDYNYILFDCQFSACESLEAKRRGFRRIAYIDPGLILLKKGK